MKNIPLIGRILYSLILVMGGINHFVQHSNMTGYVAYKGVPMPGLAVAVAGVLALAGGLSVLLGYKAKLGAWLIILFLIPVTFIMHNFWAVTDPVAQQAEMAQFMKNISMIGGALIIAYFGSGPRSLDKGK